MSKMENVADATNNLPSNDEDVILLLKTGKFGEGELHSRKREINYSQAEKCGPSGDGIKWRPQSKKNQWAHMNIHGKLIK
jgi:hypothetical protein